MKQYSKPKKSSGFLRGIFLANHLASTDDPNNQETKDIQTQTNGT